MHKKSDIELQRARIMKMTRGLIRLQKSIEADELINDILPDRLNEFDVSLQSGELKTMDGTIKKLLES